MAVATNSAQPVAAHPSSDPFAAGTGHNSRPPAEFTKDQELGAYRDMLLIRRFEEKAGQMYGMGLIGGFCHLYIGQEAVVVGMQMALKQGDGIITGYRDHGHMLACGMDAKGVMAELTGRSHGYTLVLPDKISIYQQPIERICRTPEAVRVQVRRTVAKVGRNDLCPCGSGKKYKYCHGQ